MATFIKTDLGKWKAKIRLKRFKPLSKTFRTKRDAQDWSRRSEDEMVRGIYIQRSDSERIMLGEALDRYLKEVSSNRKPDSYRRELSRIKIIKSSLGQFSLAAINSHVIAKYRDERVEEGKSNNTIRLELATLGHLFSIAIKEWGIGLAHNPVLNVRKPSAGKGRERRLNGDEETRLLSSIDEHSNPTVDFKLVVA